MKKYLFSSILGLSLLGCSDASVLEGTDRPSVDNVNVTDIGKESSNEGVKSKPDDSEDVNLNKPNSVVTDCGTNTRCDVNLIDSLEDTSEDVTQSNLNN